MVRTNLGPIVFPGQCDDRPTRCGSRPPGATRFMSAVRRRAPTFDVYSSVKSSLLAGAAAAAPHEFGAVLEYDFLISGVVEKMRLQLQLQIFQLSARELRLNLGGAKLVGSGGSIVLVKVHCRDDQSESHQLVREYHEALSENPV